MQAGINLKIELKTQGDLSFGTKVVFTTTILTAVHIHYAYTLV